MAKKLDNLDEYAKYLFKECANNARKEMMKELGKYRKVEAKILRDSVKAETKKSKKKGAKHLSTHVKYDKVKKYRDMVEFRVKVKAPHAMLVEYGHAFPYQMGAGQQVKGRRYFGAVKNEMDEVFNGAVLDIVNKWINNEFGKG